MTTSEQHIGHDIKIKDGSLKLTEFKNELGVKILHSFTEPVLELVCSCNPNKVIYKVYAVYGYILNEDNIEKDYSFAITNSDKITPSLIEGIENKNLKSALYAVYYNNLRNNEINYKVIS